MLKMSDEIPGISTILAFFPAMIGLSSPRRPLNAGNLLARADLTRLSQDSQPPK